MALRTRTPSCVALIVFALPLILTACANPAEQAGYTQWSFDGTQYAATAEGAGYTPYESASPGDSGFSGTGPSNEAAIADDWAKRTYVYRGGRDPKTGLAYKQM